MKLKPEEIVEQIISSPEEVVEIEVNSESREIDKSVFEAIKGTDKTVSLSKRMEQYGPSMKRYNR